MTARGNTDTARRRDTHAKQRKRLRKVLEAQGVEPDRIAAIIATKRERQLAQRSTPELEAARSEEARRRLENETYARLSLDDRGYRPNAGDPLLRGAARATGQTAKAVRRGSTVTQWQHDEAT